MRCIIRYNKLFFFIWMILTVGILVRTIFYIGELVEVVGWEFNKSRILNDYIQFEVQTANLMPNKKNFCDKFTFLTIICISAPKNFEARKTIRETWGHEKYVLEKNVSVSFLLGQTNNLDLIKNITEEALEYGDIIQENFYDTYNNLSIKSAMMLKVFTLNCPSSNYLLKIDDDVFLNLPKLIEDLISKNSTENLLMGSEVCGSKPIRDSTDKWYAGPPHLYADKIYPCYLSGPAYCMSANVAEKLFESALQTPIFHVEDVYFTGICAQKSAIKLTNNNRFTIKQMKFNNCLYKHLITVHYQTPKDILEIFKIINDPRVEIQCQETENTIFVRKWLNEHISERAKSKIIKKFILRLYNN